MESAANWKRLFDAIRPPETPADVADDLQVDDGPLEPPDSLDPLINAVLRLAYTIETDFGARHCQIAQFLYIYADTLLQKMDPTSCMQRGVMQFKIRLKRKVIRLNMHNLGTRIEDFKKDYSSAMNPDQKEVEDANLWLLKRASKDMNVATCDTPMIKDFSPRPKFTNVLQISIREGSMIPPHEVKDAVEILGASTARSLVVGTSGLHNDLFRVLEMFFGFQAGNANNQWENLVLLLSNAHLQCKSDHDGTNSFENTCHEVCDKVMENFNNWCDYLQIDNVYKSGKIDHKRKLWYTALYLLIWGEAANVRFLPECLCSIFHKMSKDLDQFLSHEISYDLGSSRTFLKDYIEPIYSCLLENMTKMDDNSYSNHCNYDDMNEYFWSRSHLKLDSQLNHNFRFLARDDEVEKKVVGTKKNLFIEHRTYLHLYHSFHRLWIFMILAFQILAIVQFSNYLGLDRVKLLLSIGPTYFLMMCIESILDIYMMCGALTHAKKMTKIMISLRVLWFGIFFAIVCYLYKLVLTEDGYHFLGISVTNLYIGLHVLYIVCHFLVNISTKVRASRSWTRTCHRWRLIRFLPWIYKEYYYVGQRLHIQTLMYLKYAVFWMLVLACKFSFSFFFQIKPLVEPSVYIANYEVLDYLWPDFLSKGNHNAFTILTLWIPVVLIYLGDIQIWYTLIASVLGGLIGARRRLGEIHSLELLRQTFHEYPASYAKKMVAQNQQSSHIPGSSEHMVGQNQQSSQDMGGSQNIFVSYWNDIISCLREEDYINNSEKEFLMFPSQDLEKWPLFLLLGKVSQAADMAKAHNGNKNELWERMDRYMKFAIKEACTGLEAFLERKLTKRQFQSLSTEYRMAKHKRWESFDFKQLPDIVGGALDLIWKELRKQKRIDVSKVNNTHAFISLLERFFKMEKNHLHDDDEPAEETRIDEMKLPMERLQHLLARDRFGNIPKNPEARRRLMFFVNSLFMEMPQAKSVETMKSFSVLTSYSSGDVIYTIEQLSKVEDGISMLFYLQKVFQDEWENFLERLNTDEETLMRNIKMNKRSKDAMLLRLWASYRGQTLARTVRGMMYYHKALQSQEFQERSTGQNSFANSNGLHTKLKFTYIVTCDRYGQQKQEKRDILYLMEMFESLRVAFVETNELSSDGKSSKEYFSKLVKVNINGQEEEIYKIRLPGDPWLGERKSENQNHAIIFTRGDALQSTVANQDNYFEEALKLRNLLEEFSHRHVLQPPSILGVRAHAFTGSVSSVSWFASNHEEYSCTLHQRILANPLKIRMTYGHGDVFDRVFHMTRGGISKASRNLNSSEDVFAGYNSTLRNGDITHHEYIEVGIGCFVDLNQLTTYEGKVASSIGEQLLSRDLYRLGQLFDFFRMMSLYVSSVGSYVWCMLVVLSVYFFLYGRAYLAFSGIGRYLEDSDGSTDSVLVMEFVFEIGIVAAIPIFIMFIIDQSAFKALVMFVTMQLQFYSVFYTFLLGTWAHHFGRAILHGFVKHQMQYPDINKSYFVQHIRFAENYRLYSRSHFVKALEIMMLLLVCINYGFGKTTTTYTLLSLTSWFIAVSWISAPFLFNPAGYEWQKTVEDFADWSNWIFYKSGTGLDVKKSWETWWNNEQKHIRTFYGRILETILCLRFFIFQYGVVYRLRLVKQNTSLLVYIYSWLVFFVLVLISTIYSLSQKNYANAQGFFLRFVQGIISMLLIITIFALVIFFKISAGDIFAVLLAFIPTGWAVVSSFFVNMIRLIVMTMPEGCKASWTLQVYRRVPSQWLKTRLSLPNHVRARISDTIAVAWKPVVQKLRLWDLVRTLAKFYDAFMGILLFIPVVMLSWFPFVSTFHTRLVFNQAFSRSWEISLILGTEQPALQETTSSKKRT